MGRGKSGAGAGSGTVTASNGVVASATLPKATNQVMPPTPQQVAKGDVLPQGGVAFSDFEKMTDDQKADVIDKALRTGVPMFLDDSGLQRFAYFTGMSDKPAIVSDAQLDKMSGRELFRTVSDVYNRQKDIGYTANDIIKQISSGDFTMYSDSGGSAHGKAIYFASSVSSSAVYAGRNSSMMRAKVTGGKAISQTAATNAYRSAYARGDKLARACSRAGGSSAVNLYTLAKGYDIITTSDYHMVLNRRCLTVSDKVKPKVTYNTKSW